MFTALKAAGLALKPSKTSCGPEVTTYLGHIISTGEFWSGLIVAKPRCSFLGIVNIVRRIIKNYGEATAALTELTQKAFVTKNQFLEGWVRPITIDRFRSYQATPDLRTRVEVSGFCSSICSSHGCVRSRCQCIPGTVCSWQHEGQ